MSDPQSLILRPSPHAQSLVDNLQSAAVIKKIQPRRRLHMTVSNVHYCYLIIEGRVSVHRQHDDMAIGTLAAPGLIGISMTETHAVSGYLKTLTPCTIGVMTAEEALNVVTEKQLWETLSRHLMVVASKIYTYSQNITAPTTYDIVRLQLQELMDEDPSVRDNITIENYISGKVNLSRSSIMRVLSDLRHGGFIEIHRGVLINIVSLPEEL